jgi:hypothetical protein
MSKYKMLFLISLWTVFLVTENKAVASTKFPEKPYEYSIDSSWKKINSPAGQMFPDNYVFTKNEKIKINIIYHSSNKAGVPITEKNQISSEFLAGRKKMNDLMGVSDWVISQHDVQKKGQVTILIIAGKYTDPSGVNKRFEERNYFLGEKLVVARLSYDEKNKDPKAISAARDSFEKLKLR